MADNNIIILDNNDDKKKNLPKWIPSCFEQLPNEIGGQKIDAPTEGDIPRDGSIPFYILATLFVLWKKKLVKPSSVTIYVLSIKKHIIPVFGDHTHKIKDEEVQQFAETLLQEKGLGIKFVKDICILLRMVVEFGALYFGWQSIAMRSIHIDREERLKEIARKRQERNYLLLKEHKTLAKYCATYPDPKRLAILVAVETGVRIGELCALQWRDYDPEYGTISINKAIQRIDNALGVHSLEELLQNPDVKAVISVGNKLRGTDGKPPKSQTVLMISTPKTANAVRTIPLPHHVNKLLKHFSKVMHPDFFIASGIEKPVEPRIFREFYVKVLRELNLPVIKFHGLRHTYATRLIEAGMDFKTASHLLGHADITTTLKIYAHVTPDKARQAIDQAYKKIGIKTVASLDDDEIPTYGLQALDVRNKK